MALMPQLMHAATISHTESITRTKTNWSESVTIPQFDSSNGTLTKITFSLASEIDGTLKIESVDASPATVTSSLAAELKLKRPDDSTLLTHSPSEQKIDNFTAYDGTLDYDGDSGETHAIATSSTGTSELDPPDATDIALFSGNSTITLPVTSEGISSFQGAGNLQSESTLYATADVTVTYEYIAPDLTITKTANGAFTIGSVNTFRAPAKTT